MKNFRGEKLLRYFLFLLIILFLTGPMILFASSEEVSLEKFLLLVQLENNTLKSSASRLESTYYAVRSAVSYQRPALVIQGTSNSITGENAENTISAGITQRIDISGTYSAQEKSAIYGYLVQAETHRKLVNDILSSSESLYWRGVMALENIDLYRNILKQRQENLRITEEQFRQDLIPMLDVIRAETKVEESISLLTQAESDYRDILAQISTLIAGLEVTPLRTSLIPPDMPRVRDVEETCSGRPDIRSLEFALEKAGMDLNLATKGLSPTLDAFLGWTAWSDSARISPAENEILLSLTLNVPITDGNNTKNQVREKEETIKGAKRELEARKDKAREEIILAQNRWEKALALRKSREKQAQLAEEELRITTLLYTEGLGSQLDLLNAQTEHVRANTERLDTIKELYLALVDMKRACGTYATEYTDRDWIRYREW